MADLSPIAKLMGFSFEETAGLLTPVIEVFGSGSESARALRTGLLKLIDDTNPVSEALAALGISQTTANGALRSGKDILLDVAKAFKGLSEPQKLFITQQLVGIDQSAKMVEVFNGLSKVTEVTAVGLGAAGSAAKEVALRLISSQVQIDRFRVGFENLGIIVGEKFKESATKAIEGANDIMAAFSGMVTSGTFDPIFNLLKEFGDTLYKYLSTIAKNLPAAFAQVDFSGLLKALKDLGGSLGSMFDGMDLTTVDGLAKAINTVKDIIIGLIRTTEGMVEQFKPFISVVSDFFIAIGKGDKESQNTIGAILALGKAVQTAGLALVVGALLIKEYGVSVSAMVGIVGGAGQILWNGLQLLGNAVQGIFIVATGAFLEFLNSLSFNTFKYTDTYKNMASTIEEAGKKLSANIDQNGLDAKRGLDRIVSGFTELDGAAKLGEKSVAGVGEALKGYTTDINAIPSKINTEATLTMKVDAEGKDAEQVKKMLAGDYRLDPLIQSLIVVPDPVHLVDTQKKIETAIPKKKEIDVELKLDIEKLKIQGDIIQSAIEWKAKIDISNIEAGAEKFKAVFSSIDTSITSTGGLMSDLFKIFAGDDVQGSKKWAIEDAIKSETEQRKKSFDLQDRMAESEIRMNDARMRQMARGDAMITIDGAGLQPHLEAFMFEILSAIQIRANEEGAAFLVGM